MDDSYRIGISGWTYDRWRKTFYPKGLQHRLELKYASEHLRTIEINGTFYSLQSPKSYLRWYDETPKDFKFSVKAPRFITHIKRLKDVEAPLANFFASGVLALKEKLGPILWQLPPNFLYSKERLTEFFELLPRTTSEAKQLAKRHDRHLKEKPYMITDRVRPIIHALEVRHPSFKENEKEFLALLKKYKIAIVWADAPTKWPYFEQQTARFAYARLHGGSMLYTSTYSQPELKKWAKCAKKWHGRNREVYIYFDNDAKVHAPFNAMELQEILS